MKIIISMLLTLYCFSTTFGQTRKSIEISLLGRYDRHGNYVSNFAGRVYNDTNKIYGFSYGINGIYRHKISKSYTVSFGVGYYKLKVDKIKGNLPFNIPGTRTGRNINYDDGFTNLLYGTEQYHYNNLAITIGLDKIFVTKNNLKFDIGAEVIGYKTISQKYRLGRGSQFYRTKNGKPLEFGANLTAGIIKEFKKIYLQPSLIIPVYQNLKGDKVFYEDPDMNISKWFNGIGLCLKVGKYL
jgi:hypothetical protein